MTSFAHSLYSACLAALLLLPLASHAAGNVIVVGQAIDLSGPNAAIGRDYVAGIKTYFDALNASGGIHGRRIQYIVRDDQGLPAVAVNAVTELIERDQVDFLFGGVGDSTTHAVLDAPAFKRSSHILFAPLASGTSKPAARILFWRPSYKQEIRHIFSHFSQLGIKDIGVVYQETASNQEAYQDLAAEIRDRGIRLTGTARISMSGDQIAAEANRLAGTRPGFVIVIADTIGTALFLKEFRKRDSRTFIAGTSLINLSMLRELAGAKAVEWTVFSQVVPSPNAGASLLQLEHMNMMKKYRDEAVSSLTLEGFAAAKSLAKAIQQSKRPFRSSLVEMIVQDGTIDLGGLAIGLSPNSNRLSNYLDIALFKKGSELVF